MTQIRKASECDCETCIGSESDPDKYGGWFCLCSCHHNKSTEEDLTDTLIVTEEEFEEALLQQSEATKIIEAYRKQEGDTNELG